LWGRPDPSLPRIKNLNKQIELHFNVKDSLEYCELSAPTSLSKARPSGEGARRLNQAHIEKEMPRCLIEVVSIHTLISAKFNRKSNFEMWYNLLVRVMLLKPVVFLLSRQYDCY
jgi:hypothetical protein